MSSGPAKLLVARSSPTPLKFESSGEIPCGDALSRRLSDLRSSLELLPGEKNMRASRQVRLTCTPAN
ncbi:MAG: hypothetical protein V8T87_10005 [Victivallales bacterium]